MIGRPAFGFGAMLAAGGPAYTDVDFRLRRAGI